MTSATEPSTVTSAQLIAFAANVNDRRVVDEARELAAVCGVAPDHVAAITYEPVRGARQARLVFTTYVLDEAGERVTEEVVQNGRALLLPTTTTQEVRFKGQIPTWWPQAVRTPMPVREQEDA